MNIFKKATFLSFVLFCFFLFLFTRCCQASRISFYTLHSHPLKCTCHRKFGLITSACFIPGCLPALWEGLILWQLVRIPPLPSTFICKQRRLILWFHSKDTQNLKSVLTWWTCNFKYCFFEKNQTFFFSYVLIYREKI